jgi:hypothetical protein
MGKWRGADRIDANQKLIMADLRRPEAKGWLSVVSTHSVGKGFGDIVVGVAGRNFIFEIKISGSGRLSDDESTFHADWNGHIEVVTSAKDVVNSLLRQLPSNLKVVPLLHKLLSSL